MLVTAFVLFNTVFLGMRARWAHAHFRETSPRYRLWMIRLRRYRRHAPTLTELALIVSIWLVAWLGLVIFC